MTQYILAIDQGTTSTRAFIFDKSAHVVGKAQFEFDQHFPNEGWVEHDPEDIWHTAKKACDNAIKDSKINIESIVGIGITNQRETTILWDKQTGKAIYPAIVWQDRRTAKHCEQLKNKGLEETIREKTGLLLDPYFSATKIYWILENVPGAREKAENGEILFGTVETYLLWKLTNGKSHATDPTNACRTLLFNIHTQNWDNKLLEKFNIPACILPEVKDNASEFGETELCLFGATIPILGMCGDQQGALIGQSGFNEGLCKSTFGTGGFLLLNTGAEAHLSENRLLTTVAYRLNGKVTYAVEGSFFIAGAVVKWLRDKLGIIQTAAETEALAKTVEDTGGVYVVPAFTGLGAPYWNPYARGQISGLTRDSDRAHIVRAALESIAYQTKDLLDAMQKDGHIEIKQVRVDGGMVENSWYCQFLANILNIEVVRPKNIETTILGSAFLAGLQAGLYQSTEDISRIWEVDRTFKPNMSSEKREALYAGWQNAIKSVVCN